MTVQPGAQPRAERECDECHVTDDLGHHQVIAPEDGALVMRSFHFACCVARGCPDGTCDQILTGAPPGEQPRPDVL
jgi:hypothetical protein